MSDDTNVRGALLKAAEDFLTTGDFAIPKLAIAWENRISKAAQDFPLWASVFYRPNNPVSRTIGRNGIDQITGFLQIDLNIPLGTGEKDLIDWESKGREFFAPGNRFSLDSTSVLVTESGIGQGRSIENNFRKSYTVVFKADLKRKNKT